MLLFTGEGNAPKGINRFEALERLMLENQSTVPVSSKI